MREVHVSAFWDAEASVWVAESEDVPGLVTEAASLDALMAKLKILIPELLIENGIVDRREVQFEVNATAIGTANLAAAQMAGFTPDVKRILAQNGCWFVRHGKGDHDIWHSPITNKSFPVDSDIKSRHTANGIMKQAGISHRF